MIISEIITQSRVMHLTSVSSKKRLFQEISNKLAAECGLTNETIFNALKDREQLGPTGMGNGIAIPHAKVACIDSIKGLFIKLEKPVEFEAIDKKKVDLIFTILAPIQSGVDHLKALAKVSRLLRDKDICSKLRSTEDITALFSILIQDWDIEAA